VPKARIQNGPRAGQKQPLVTPGSAYRKRSEQVISFTARFHAKARERTLTEEHARFVYYVGDTVRPNA
jgi:hypothetical protein